MNATIANQMGAARFLAGAMVPMLSISPSLSSRTVGRRDARAIGARHRPLSGLAPMWAWCLDWDDRSHAGDDPNRGWFRPDRTQSVILGRSVAASATATITEKVS